LWPPCGGRRNRAAQHRRQRERHDARDHHGGADDDREFVQEPADHAAMKRTGMNTAASEMVMAKMVNPISAEPLSAAVMRILAGFHPADDVLQHDHGVVHHEADAERERHQRDDVDRVAERVHDGERPHDRQRHRQAGDQRGRDVAQEDEDDQHHQADGQQQRELHVVHGLADRRRPVVDDVQAHRGRQLLAERRQQRAHRVHHLDGVGAGLPLDGQHHRAVVVEPAGHLVGLHAVDDLAELVQRTGEPLRYAHHRGGRRRVHELAGRLHVDGLVRPYSVPVGLLTLPRAIAVATSSMPMPRVASARGSTCTRTAYFCEPKTSPAPPADGRDALGQVGLRSTRPPCRAAAWAS
jgi:hypothetical protein